MPFFHRIPVVLLALVCLMATDVLAQSPRVRQPGPFAADPINVTPGNPAPVSSNPSRDLVPVTPTGVGTASGSTLNTPSFDPYTTSVSGAPSSSVYGTQVYSPYASTPPGIAAPPPGSGTAPYGASPYLASPPSVMPYGGVYPPSPSPPNALFPESMFGQSGGYDPQLGTALKLIQNPRVRDTYLFGDDGTDVSINDAEVALTVAFPNFLGSGQPVFISPTFILHSWDGPQPPSLSELPSTAYSAYLDSFWRSDPNRILGAELNAIVGVFTDFDILNKDSLRLQGTALGTLRLTPTLQLKAGATYLDRLDIKILPAGGILWEPNPQTRFDLYFPRPKLSQYLTTVGNTDIWWYLAGEYGGGSWTIERPTGLEDRIDINDIRAMAGLDWLCHSGVKAFFEVGYVFEREVIYERNPLESFKPKDTVMLRAGIAF